MQRLEDGRARVQSPPPGRIDVLDGEMQSPLRSARRQQGRRAARTGGDTAELRETILAATASLLTERSFSDLTVGNILSSTGVSRGTFYFYFQQQARRSRRTCPARGRPGSRCRGSLANQPGRHHRGAPRRDYRGARLWQSSAPILRAIVENWHIEAVASSLMWLGELLYYLAATGTPPFDDQDALIDTLLHIWTSTRYGSRRHTGR